MKRLVLIILIFVLLTIILTFPLVFKINKVIPGFHSTDEAFAPIYRFWWARFSNENKLDIDFCNYLAHPFGINFGEDLQLYPYWSFIFYRLAKVINGILLYNMELVLGFILSGFFMYLLVRFLTQSELCGIFSGIVFAFCPYHFVRVWQQYRLAQIQWIVLFIFSLVLLNFWKDWRRALFVGLSFLIVASYEFYYTLFIIIVSLFFLIFILLYDKKNSFRVIKKSMIVMVVVMVLLSPVIFPIIKDLFFKGRDMSGLLSQGYIRFFQDLFKQSTFPLSYFIPSSEHPILGGFTKSLIGSKLYGISFTEHTLYLGWTPFLLAFVAFKRWRRRKDFYIGFFILLAIVAWFFSQPPWWKIGPIKIFMPSFFMYKILPMFRAYSRFGIMVMLAVAVLAGFGLKFILERFKSQKVKIALTCLFSGLVLFEFWNWPPYKVIDVSRVPAVYYWLKTQPQDFVIAEYPLDINGPNEMFKFYQTKHEKKIINGTRPITYTNKLAKTITKLSQPHTTGVLKWMEVKYVLVHREDYLKTELIEEIEELNKIPLNPNLKLIKSFPAQECPRKDIMCVQKTGPIDVYEVITEPIEPLAEK